MAETVNNPQHYGGANNPYEVINVIEAWELDFTEGNIIKYVSRYKQKNGIEDLKKAQWYLSRLIQKIEFSERKK